jgi:hypothetical protein
MRIFGLQGEELTEDGEKYVMRSIIVFTSYSKM